MLGILSLFIKFCNKLTSMLSDVEPFFLFIYKLFVFSFKELLSFSGCGWRVLRTSGELLHSVWRVTPRKSYSYPGKHSDNFLLCLLSAWARAWVLSLTITISCMHTLHFAFVCGALTWDDSLPSLSPRPNFLFSFCFWFFNIFFEAGMLCRFVLLICWFFYLNLK